MESMRLASYEQIGRDEMQPGANAWQDPEGRCQEDMGGSSENWWERFSAPRREQASMVSLKFSCTLAEHMLCSCGQHLGGAHQHLTKWRVSKILFRKWDVVWLQKLHMSSASTEYISLFFFILWPPEEKNTTLLWNTKEKRIYFLKEDGG